MSVNKSKPVYSTGVAADLSGLSPDTLRNYEKAGLIKPHRTKGGKRLYSQNDVDWLICIKQLLEKGYNTKVIKKLLQYEPCWQLNECPEEIKAKCQIIKDNL
ncbi:MAG TPA: MerR family transcriptional regulator [Cyanobacteria bacterium UBA9971]|nr:MerR family transcriptional regulator [Cyanobacteria bacterium UBA9971]